MSFHATLYPGPETVYYIPRVGTPSDKTDRVICRIEVDGCAIQTNTWQDMQRLADELSAQAAAAKQAEQDAALAVAS